MVAAYAGTRKAFTDVVRYGTAQILSSLQKDIARGNIGLAATDSVAFKSVTVAGDPVDGYSGVLGLYDPTVGEARELFSYDGELLYAGYQVARDHGAPTFANVKLDPTGTISFNNGTSYIPLGLSGSDLAFNGSRIALFSDLSSYQPLDADLTAIAALTTTTFGRSLLTQADAATTRATIGAGTSSFDGAFSSLSGKPTTLSGYGITDATTNARSALSFVAGSGAYNSTTGVITIPTNTSQLSNGAGYLTGNQSITVSGDATGSGTTSIALTLATVATAGTYRSVTVNAKGLVTAGTNPTTLAGYGITDAVTSGGALGTPSSGTLTNCTGYTFANIASKPTTLSGYGITDSVALTTGKLSQFAATTSSELAGVISDETGSGALVFGTAPTISNPTFNQFNLSGNISSAAWTTSGIRIKGVPATFTDTTSAGTVAAAYTNHLGGNTIAASNAVTFTNYITTFIQDPVAGTNVTFTNRWALGAESARFGTSNQVTISNSGVLSAISPVFTGTPVCRFASGTPGTDELELSHDGTYATLYNKKYTTSQAGRMRLGNNSVLFGAESTVIGFRATWSTSTNRVTFSMGSDTGAQVANVTMANVTASAGLRLTGAGTGFIEFWNAADTAQDLVIVRDAADTLGQRRGTNAQTWRLYGTYTDASNYRRLYLSSTTGGAFTLGVEGLGTGAAGNTLAIAGLSTITGASGDIIINSSTGTDVVFQSNGTETFRVKSGSQGIAFVSTSQIIKFAGTTGLAQNANGVVEVNSGTAGTLRDLLLRDITLTPSTTRTLSTNGQFSIEMTSNTAGNLVYRGSDGVTRRFAFTVS